MPLEPASTTRLSPYCELLLSGRTRAGLPKRAVFIREGQTLTLSDVEVRKLTEALAEYVQPPPEPAL